MSNIVNKVKDAISGHKDHAGHGAETSHLHTSTTSNPNYGSTNAGPHESNLANKIDPRVDSDLDGSRTIGNTGNTGTSGFTSSTYPGGYDSTGSTNHGPHSSNIANKLDPRVDSDRDGSATIGNTGPSAYGGSTMESGCEGTSTSSGSTNYGPHNSNIANKLDPRVDSDRDGSVTVGNTGPKTYNTAGGYSGSTIEGGYGGTSTSSGSTNYGPHNSNIANKLDPRVDSDLDGSRTIGNTNTTGTYGPSTHSSNVVGSGSTNAGPHESNLLNKLDPRVDSDLDGSKTIGNTQFGTRGTGSNEY